MTCSALSLGLPGHRRCTERSGCIWSCSTSTSLSCMRRFRYTPKQPELLPGATRFCHQLATPSIPVWSRLTAGGAANHPGAGVRSWRRLICFHGAAGGASHGERVCNSILFQWRLDKSTLGPDCPAPFSPAALSHILASADGVHWERHGQATRTARYPIPGRVLFPNPGRRVASRSELQFHWCCSRSWLHSTICTHAAWCTETSR